MSKILHMPRLLALVLMSPLGVHSSQSFADERIGPHVVLTDSCDPNHLVEGLCPVSITIDGSIIQADADAFHQILRTEAQRTGKQVRPTVTISSDGGDVYAAMQIGRELRHAEGFIFTTFPEPICYSACVLIAAGAVIRTAWGIGIHRPYFVDATPGNIAEADFRYKKLMGDVRDYLHEMNMPDEVFEIMQSVGPDEIKLLTSEESDRLGFSGEDPAYEEAEIAVKAHRYGLTSAEYRVREARILQICGRPEDAGSAINGQQVRSSRQMQEVVSAELMKREKCAGQIEGQTMWGIDRAAEERIWKTVGERCIGMPWEGTAWNECVRVIGQAIKTGQPVPASLGAPPGWEFVDSPDEK